jgi:serine/threonine-protein kinase RsbW
MTNHDAVARVELVELTVPLATRYASLLRVVAAAVGADAGFSIDEIDDVRLGLNEAFALLAEQSADGRVRTTFSVDADRELEIHMTPESGAVAVEPDELALAILRSVLDHYELGTDTIVLHKRATEAG